MAEPLRILVGGVPLGCDNVGDEAILECAVRIIRELCPDCLLTVSTNDEKATAEKLNVQTCPLYAFVQHDLARMTDMIRAHDVFFWCGATGLSDYPEVPLQMVEIAQSLDKCTIVWGVGMNSELNPAKYEIHPGKKRALLTALTALSFGLFNAIKYEENRLENRARNKIADCLEACELVVLRDPESRDEVSLCGVNRELIVGADSALVLEPAPPGSFEIPEEAQKLLRRSVSKVGLCVSAQREIKNQDELVRYLDRVVEDDTKHICFIPMNPITDARLMTELQGRMAHPERTAVLSGRYEPDQILAVAKEMDVVVSSRLHLLILASIVHVPVLGISRGSKVDNFLRPFGLRSANSVENCDFGLLWTETLRLLGDRAGFETRSRAVQSELLARLEDAKRHLGAALQEAARSRTA
ncbi:MAG: polysaccharide pyruvyl transferase family protein [Candidatus Hydrogenedentes bacterium]|nr:polysaccharide pyruvyl transferase family protein [Candidatus Hydrogenedentota bacterium]